MKKIALINDLSGFGRCSLTASIPVISAMGIQACPLPTAILSAQTGFADYYCDDYTDKMDLITDSWNKMNAHFDGIHSGYLAGPGQIKKVLHFLDIFKTPGTIYLADPVLGDHGIPMKSYSKELLQGMKQLCRQADVCTPNLTELCLLTGKSYENLTSCMNDKDYIRRITDTARLLIKDGSCTAAVTTGIIRRDGGRTYIGNLAVTCTDTLYMETVRMEKSFSGTGDLFAAILCGALVKGKSLKDAMRLAADFLQPAIEEAVAAGTPGAHGIPFENQLPLLF